VCPAHVAICFGLAPAAIHSETAVWRRSWGRSGSSPAALMAGALSLTPGLCDPGDIRRSCSVPGRTSAVIHTGLMNASDRASSSPRDADPATPSVETPSDV
jgi:hypothetical protein